MTEKAFYEVIEAVCKRPQLYTPSGTFNEGVSFIDGFWHGANVGDEIGSSAMGPFHRWLVQKFAIDDVIVGWAVFRGRFSSDAEAFEKLRVLYLEYVDQLDV